MAVVRLREMILRKRKTRIERMEKAAIRDWVAEGMG